MARFFVFWLLAGTVMAVADDAAMAPDSGLDLAAYSIVHAEDAPPSVVQAAALLRDTLERATGTRLPVVQTATEAMIVLGDTEWSRAAGMDARELPWEAARLCRNGNHLFIVGRDMPGDALTPEGGVSLGTWNGTLTFLEDVVGVRWLMPGEHGTHVPRHESFRWPDRLDRIDAPGFAYRSLWLAGDDEWYARQRLGRGGKGGSLNLDYNHSWNHLFPEPGGRYADCFETQRETFDLHPDWFAAAADGVRIAPPGGAHWSLCPTAPGLTEEIARRIGVLREKKDRRMFSISPNDGCPTCRCPECQSRLEPRRADYFDRTEGWMNWAPVVLDHYRSIAEIVQRTHPDVILGGLLYQNYGQPPATPVPLPSNVVGSWAPAEHGYGPMRLAPETNRQWRRLLRDWKASVDRLHYWGLELYMRQYAGAPSPVYADLLEETFRTLRDQGFVGAFFFGNEGWGHTALMNYVLARLLWNPGADVRALARDFCRAAYGEAGDEILDMYRGIERDTIAFVNANRDIRLSYILSTEMLRDVYAAGWDDIEGAYRRGLARVTDPAARWRLERLGDNLALLYYHLVVLNFIAPDPNSPLHNDPEEYEVRHAAFGWSQGVRSPLAWRFLNIPHRTPHFNRAFAPPHHARAVYATVTPAAAPLAVQTAGESPFVLRLHQEVLLYAPEDGRIEIELGFETNVRERTGEPMLPSVPYYTVMDESLRSIHTGIARNNRTISFPGEKGRHYWLALTDEGIYANGSRYTFAANVPFALGDRMKEKGLLFRFNHDPLYFHVPADVPRFELVLDTEGVSADIVRPDGTKADGMENAHYRLFAFEKGDTAWDGFWSVVFHTPLRGYVRQDRALSGFFTTDPSRPLIIRRDAP